MMKELLKNVGDLADPELLRANLFQDRNKPELTPDPREGDWISLMKSVMEKRHSGPRNFRSFGLDAKEWTHTLVDGIWQKTYSGSYYDAHEASLSFERMPDTYRFNLVDMVRFYGPMYRIYGTWYTEEQMKTMIE